MPDAPPSGGGTATKVPFFEKSSAPEHVKGQTIELDSDDVDSINTPLGGPNLMEGLDGEIENKGSFKLEFKEDEHHEKEKVDFDEQKSDEENLQGKQDTGKAKQELEKDNKGVQKTEDKTSKGLIPKIQGKQGQQESQTENRDYSVFPEEVAEAIKKTPNSVFNTIYKYAKEIADREGALKTEYEDKLKNHIPKESLDEKGIPLNYYSHPQAFTLTPEFQQASIMSQRADYQAQFWQEQYARIEAGEPWQDLIGWNKETGQPVFNPQPIEDISGRAKAHIVSQLNKSMAQSQQFQSHIQQMAGAHKVRHEHALGFLNHVKEREFAWYKDKKAPQWQKVNEFINSMPPEIRNEQSLEIAGMMFATVVDLINHINTKAVTKQQEEQIKQDDNKVEEAVKTGVVTDESPQRRRTTGVPTTMGRNRVTGQVDLASLED